MIDAAGLVTCNEPVLIAGNGFCPALRLIPPHINHVAILQPLTIPNKFIFVFCKNIFLDSIGNVFTLHQNTQL